MFQFVNLDIFRVTFSESGVNYTRSGLIQPQYSTKIWPYTQISTHTGTEKEAERDREERNTGKSCKSELWNTDISSYTCCLTLEILKTWSTNQSYWKNSQCKNRCFFFTLLWVAKNRGGFGFSGGDCLSQVQKECAGGRIVWVGAWVDGGATNLGCSDEFVWSPAVCLPVTPKIH